MFNEARRRGALPPHLEMIVSVADKPRLSPPRAPRFGLPIFSWVTEYGLGSGNPAAWTGALPFPTWFNWPDRSTLAKRVVGAPSTRRQFEGLRPVLFFRGRWS